MYSQWQAAWSGAIACGIVLLVAACAQTWAAIRPGAPPIPLFGVAILMAGISIPIMALAFRCGLHLANFSTPGRSFVIAAAAISLGFIAALALFSFPNPTAAFHLDLPSAPSQLPGQSRHMALMVPRNPIEAVMLPYFALPVIAAFGVARFMRWRADAA